MHVNHYRPANNQPAGIGASLVIIATIGFGLTLIGPGNLPGVFHDPVLETHNIPIDPPPPPEPRADPVAREATTPAPHQPRANVVVPSSAPIASTTDFTPITPLPPAAPGSEVIIPTLPPPPVALPVVVGAAIDPRFAGALQPPYPSTKLREQAEGRVIARVMVGVDGRVKQIVFLNDPDPAFADATRRHAISRWRLKPATRDGVPYADWMTITLKFTLVD